TWLGFGHTIPNGEDAEPFADDTELGCMLLLTALSLPEEFQTLVVSPEKTVQFYTLYPIYREEMELKMAQGADALIDRFEVYDTGDVLDLTRPNTALA
ncbi:MAG: suppressor of fused domain protein, partial [Hymenobacter sp.]